MLKKLSPRVILLICAFIALIRFGMYYSATGIVMLIIAGLFGRVAASTESYPNGFVTAAAIGAVGMVVLFAALALNPMVKSKK